MYMILRRLKKEGKKKMLLPLSRDMLIPPPLVFSFAFTVTKK